MERPLIASQRPWPLPKLQRHGASYITSVSLSFFISKIGLNRRSCAQCRQEGKPQDGEEEVLGVVALMKSGWEVVQGWFKQPDD